MERKEIKTITTKEGKIIPVLDSREVATMMGKDHKEILQYLEGLKTKDGKVKITGIIPTLTSGGLHPLDYFIKDSYRDNKNEIRRCYLVTKMGCELLGNKQQGEKGILFSAKYVEEFNRMEETLKEKTPQLTEEEKLALQLYHGGIEAIEANKRLIELKTAQLQPKADYHDEFMNSEGLFTPTEIAARFNLSAEDLNNMLKEKKLIKRVNGTVLPTKKMPKEWRVILEGTNNGYAYKQMYYTTIGDKSLNEMLRYYEKPKKRELFEQKNFFDIFR